MNALKSVVIDNIQFDYDQLDAKTRAIVQQRTSEIKTLMRRSGQDIIDIGQKLIEVKRQLGHGHFGDWLQAEFEWSEQTARNFMQVAIRFKNTNFVDLNIAPSALYLLVSPSVSDDLREEIIEAGAQSDKGITYTNVLDLLKRQKDNADAIRNVASNGHHRTQFTGENEWYTPVEYIEAARNVLGRIDLDPASSDFAQEVIKADQHFTLDDDGLKHEWHGRVWLNPPFAQPLIVHFVEKLVGEVKARRVTEAIMLTHNYTDTAWFHLAESACSAICFTRGRIKFYKPDGEIAAPTQGQAFFYYGHRIKEFTEAFKRFGFVR